MALQRITAFAFKKGLQSFSEVVPLRTKLASSVLVFSAQMRPISSVEVKKNIYLISNEEKQGKIIDLKLPTPQDKPLVIMINWLMAKKKHTDKYAEIYLKYGFDVLNISITPWQLLWPTKGSQMVAKDILKFLEVNHSYSPLIVTGFSVGAYIWGEALVQMSSERQRYAGVIDRIVGQIWDSAADITEIPIGTPYAVFPNNKVLQNTLKQYMLYHLKTFDKVATVHYIRASQMFHTTLVKAPALLLLSKSDPIGAEKSNQALRENWENLGIQITWKCWDKSPHVGHLRAHPKEYMFVLENYLASLKIPQITLSQEKEKLQAKV